MVSTLDGNNEWRRSYTVYITCTGAFTYFCFSLLVRNSLLKHAVHVPRIAAMSLEDSQHGLAIVVRPL
jgi:hypothetical protein